MARKKKSTQDAPDTIESPSSTPPASTAGTRTPPPAKASEPSTSALIICRNKHWKYISCFHGPWLQLPPEVLESLAHSNYLSPRPHPIDPAVFFDLVKIRKSVDEATNLAVRATSGLSLAALNNSLHGGNGMLGGAASLGIGHGGGGNVKLSTERKHRMRELATAKLGHAYRLDEIAASVATMQSASSLEDVAQFVLQRSPDDMDAKYVHFFHEKIPSRMMAQCTPLDALTRIIADRPMDGSPWRTRALTRIFKGDYINSAKDLTEALRTAQHTSIQHRAGKDQLVLAKTVQDQQSRDWSRDVRLADEDQPSSLATQLYFHRAGVYFEMACQLINDALDGLEEAEAAWARRTTPSAPNKELLPETPAEKAGTRRRVEARKQLRQHAKRAIRDYMSFLSKFDYSPGLSAAAADELLHQMASQSNGQHFDLESSSASLKILRPIDSSTPTSPSISNSLMSYRNPRMQAADQPSPRLPPPKVYQISQLFDPVPPSALPPYPRAMPPQTLPPAALFYLESQELVTYHPLLPEALHSLLLCHALLQTTPKELQRHAHNAARLVRICDGYPVFLSARSPARADWMEVLRRTGNWIGLAGSWDDLCRPPAAPTHTKHRQGDQDLAPGQTNGGAAKKETDKQKKDRLRHGAVLDALADESVTDETTFQRAVEARARRNEQDEDERDKIYEHQTQLEVRPNVSLPSLNGTAATQTSYPIPPPPKRFSTDHSQRSANATAADREYALCSERAELVARWVRDAPPLTDGNVNAGDGPSTGDKSMSGNKKKRGGARAKSMKNGAASKHLVSELKTLLATDELCNSGEEGLKAA